MKLRHFQLSVVAALLLAPQINGLDFLNQFKQGVTATSNSVNAIKDTVDGLTGLVIAIDKSVTAIDQKVKELTKTANGIVTNNPQESIKNSFGTINNSLDVSIELLPAIQELTQVLSLIGDGILPTIAQFPGAASVSRDVASISEIIARITTQVTRIKVTLDQWLPKIKQLSTNLGQHAVDMTEQIEGTIADVKKIELF